MGSFVAYVAISCTVFFSCSFIFIVLLYLVSSVLRWGQIDWAIVGIFIFISRENFMLSWGEPKKSFIISEPGNTDGSFIVADSKLVFESLGFFPDTEKQ